MTILDKSVHLVSTDIWQQYGVYGSKLTTSTWGKDEKLTALSWRVCTRVTILTQPKLGLQACVYKKIYYAPHLERLLQGKGSIKYTHKDSYKEKTSKPRKRGQPSTTMKAPIPSLTKVRIIYPRSGTPKLWKVITWHSEDIWLAPHWCSLWGLLFLYCASIVSNT